MEEQFDTQSPGHSLSLRAAALSALFHVLAWLYSYPSKEQVSEIASFEFLEGCRSFLAQASIENKSLDRAFMRFEEGMHDDDRRGIAFFRAEYTRLFISPPPRISMQGSRWVKNRTPLSISRGEQYAVKQAYRQIGLRNQAGVQDPFDHLVTELDYMSYIADAEAQAWEGGDVASAREWRKLGSNFMKHHLVDLARGVSLEVQSLSDNVVMLFCAALLQAVLDSGFYETD